MGPWWPGFPLKKRIVLKHFIFPEMHFKANLFLSIMTPPPLNHPTTQPRDYQVGESNWGECGLIKVKKQIDFKIHFRWFKAFFDNFFSIKGAGWVGLDPYWKIPLILLLFFKPSLMQFIAQKIHLDAQMIYHVSLQIHYVAQNIHYVPHQIVQKIHNIWHRRYNIITQDIYIPCHRKY